jgi:hypothetical protein
MGRIFNKDKFDNVAFDKLLAQYQILLTVVVAAGSALLAAGIAFLVTGATEINHSVDLQGESQDRMLAAGFKFLESGAGMFIGGLLIVSLSGLVMTGVIQITPSPKTKTETKPIENKKENTDSDRVDSMKINQYEEELKNMKIRLEIENLKVELTKLKLEDAMSKLDQIKKQNKQSKKGRKNK